MHGESRRGWCVEERNSNCVLTKKNPLRQIRLRGCRLQKCQKNAPESELKLTS